MILRIIGTLAALTAIVLDLLLTGAIDVGFVFRAALALVAIALLWSRFAVFAGLCADVMFLPVGLYTLGAENHFRLIGVMHLVVLLVAICLGLRRQRASS